MESIRVLIVDSQPLIAASLACLLAQQSTFSVLACSSIADLVACIGSFQPAIVVIDLYQDAVEEGLETCRAVAALQGSQMIVLLARRCLVESGTFTLDAVEAGADGILLHEKLDLAGLLAALRDLEAGRSLLDPRQLRGALANRRGEPGGMALAEAGSHLAAAALAHRTAPVVETLTAREREVAHLLAAGVSTGAIAEQLFISVRTVQCHISSILAKLGAHTRAEAMVHLYHRYKSRADDGALGHQP